MTLANTREVLYLVNRAGNRPSHENAAGYFDRSIDLCRRLVYRLLTWTPSVESLFRIHTGLAHPLRH